MRIRKRYQVIPTNAKLENGHSTSNKNGYTCEYLNGALDYSTTEQVIGRWIDGKPLYRRVVVFQFTSQDWNSNSRALGKQTSSVITDINNMDYIVLKNWADALGDTFPGVYPSDVMYKYSIGVGFGKNYINLVLGTSNSENTFIGINNYLTIEYTKTTDV